MDGVLRDTREHVTKLGERFHMAALAAGDETPQDRRRLTPVVAAEKRPVAAANRDVAVGTLGGSVVDFQFAVFQKTRQRFPLIQRIADRRAGRSLGQNLRLQFQQILVSFLSSRADTRCRNASLCSAESASALARSST